jgi:hypothetical protein
MVFLRFPMRLLLKGFLRYFACGIAVWRLCNLGGRFVGVYGCILERGRRGRYERVLYKVG